MKEESVLNILMYLVKNHLQEGLAFNADEPAILSHLEKLGFRRPVINRAFAWLNKLILKPHEQLILPTPNSLRVFSEYECERLDFKCRQFILRLEQQHILNPFTREIVINQVIDLEPEGIDVNLVKWVTLIVLFNQPQEKHALARMELLILEDMTGGVH